MAATLSHWTATASIRLAPAALVQRIIQQREEATKVAENAADVARDRVGDARRELRRDEYACPVRGIVAARRIARGETIAVVPSAAVLTPAAAAALVGPSLAAAVGAVAAAQPSAHSAAGAAAPTWLPLTTRDPLLLTCAVALLRRQRGSSADTLDSPLSEWVAQWPPRAPPAAALLLSNYAASDERRAPALQRRLRAGGLTAALPPPSTNPADAAAAVRDARTQLVLASHAAAATANALASPCTPASEVVPTASLVTRFYRGEPLAIAGASGRRRPHHSASAVAESAALRHLAELEGALRSSVLEPLAAAMRRTLGAEAEKGTDEATLCDDLAWAHAMVRSRVVNLCWNVRDEARAAPHVAVVPVVDMLNHGGPLHANVAFTAEFRATAAVAARGAAPLPQLAHVLVTASRDVSEGHELLLDYNDVAQRLGFFFRFPGQGDSQKASGDRGEPARGAERRRVWADMRRIERHQLADVAPSERPADDAVRRRARDDKDDRAEGEGDAPESAAVLRARRGDAVDDALWAWAFGFVKGPAEKEREAACLWHGALWRRIARLTDVRRRGAPGDFVVGVPEGLQHLRMQRDRLQREDFGGQQIFPPQAP